MKATYDNIGKELNRRERDIKDRPWHDNREAFQQLSGEEQAILIRYIGHGDLKRALSELGVGRRLIWSRYNDLLMNQRFMAAKEYISERYMEGSDVRRELFEIELMNIAMSEIGDYTETIEEEGQLYNNKTKNWEPTGNIEKKNRFKNMEDIPEWGRKSIESIEFDGDGSIKKLKLYNKISAIETLAKLKRWVGTQESIGDAMTNKLDEISRSAESIAKRVENKLRNNMTEDGQAVIDRFRKLDKKNKKQGD